MTSPRPRVTTVVQTILGVLAIALTLTACGPVGPTYSTVFPEIPGDPPRSALPVDVVDLTGLVQGVVVLPFDPLHPPTNGVVAKGRILEVTWTGGTCESSNRLIAYRADDGRVHIRRESTPTLWGLLGCHAAGVSRALQVTLRENLRQQDVHPVLEPS